MPLKFTDEEYELHVKQFTDDPDKYLMNYKIEGKLPEVYISQEIDGKIVKERYDSLDKIVIKSDKLIEIINNNENTKESI